MKTMHLHNTVSGATQTPNGPIAPGAVVWVSFAIPGAAPGGVVPLGLTNAIVAQASGQRVQPVALVDGAVTVVDRGTLSIALESGGQVRIELSGTAGWSYSLQASTNLTHWEVLQTKAAEGGTISLWETNTAAFPQRFFRAGPLP